jgi:hypothetical protein
MSGNKWLDRGPKCAELLANSLQSVFDRDQNFDRFRKLLARAERCSGLFTTNCYVVFKSLCSLQIAM